MKLAMIKVVCVSLLLAACAAPSTPLARTIVSTDYPRKPSTGDRFSHSSANGDSAGHHAAHTHPAADAGCYSNKDAPATDRNTTTDRDV